MTETASEPDFMAMAAADERRAQEYKAREAGCALDEISYATRHADDWKPSTLWMMADAFFGKEPEYECKGTLRIDAIHRALANGDQAIALIKEVAGDDCQIDWFWNSCQGHYGEVTTTVDDFEHQGCATGGTFAMAILTALLEWVRSEPRVIEPKTLTAVIPMNTDGDVITPEALEQAVAKFSNSQIG